MSRRTTVSLNIEAVRSFIKKSCRSNVVFCEQMGRAKQQTWVTDWGRGKNLPSPEEAAKMCLILGVEPEEILTLPEDIALVRSLLPDGDVPLINGDAELTEYVQMLKTRPECRMLFQLSKAATKEEVEAAVRIIEALRKK